VIGRQIEGVTESLKTLDRPMVSVDFDASDQEIDSLCFDDRHPLARMAFRAFPGRQLVDPPPNSVVATARLSVATN
jgi:hypothetical protein